MAADNEEGVNNTEDIDATEQTESPSVPVTEKSDENVHEDSDTENISEDDLSEESAEEEDNENIDAKGDSSNGKSTKKEESTKTKGKKEKKKVNKKKAAVVHPFLERAGRKLGNIRKKMAMLKQNLKDIQTKRAQRQAKKDESETRPEIPPSASEDTLKPDTRAKVAQGRNLPAFIKINKEESDDTPESFKRGKRYMDAVNPVSKQTEVDTPETSPSTSRKRKHDGIEELTPSNHDTESLTNNLSGSKKSRRSTGSMVSTSSGSMVVSDMDGTGTFKTPSSAKSQKGQ